MANDDMTRGDFVLMLFIIGFVSGCCRSRHLCCDAVERNNGERQQRLDNLRNDDQEDGKDRGDVYHSIV